MSLRSLDEEFEFVLPKMGKAKGPISDERRRLLVWQAIGGGKGRAGAQVMVKITSYATSAQKLAMHLDYISRNGEKDVFDPDGINLCRMGDAADLEARREAIQLRGQELAADILQEKKKTGRPRTRVSMNLLLSMPAGTDKAAFELAVGDFLTGQFADHEYLYTFHDDRDHYHAHVVVGMRGADGYWLRPQRSDLLVWRQRFASSLQQRGIAAHATPSYSRGKPKSDYRRDLEELDKRGTRRVPRPAPTYDGAKEAAAIEERRRAWTRIGAHYGEAGEADLAKGIAAYVAEHFLGGKARDEAARPNGRGGRGR
jgi:hypothetical protein